MQFWTKKELDGFQDPNGSIAVYDWENFTSHLNRTRASTLDFRKISYVKGPDETWSDIFEVAPSFRHVTKVQLPKISAHLLIALASKLPSSLESLSASNVSKELDLEELVESTSGLRELRLKSLSSGPLRISSTLSPLRSLNLTSLSLLSLEGLSDSDLREISALSDLRELSLGDVTGNANIFQELSKLGRLKNLRLESVHVNASLQCMEACPLEKLELVDSHLEQGFGSGFIRLRSLKKLLLIPVYKDEVAAINAEIVDFALSMPSLSHFCLGLTNEWLDSMNSILSMTADKSAPVRDSFPILVNGVCEMYSLYKLFKTLSAALPMSKVKVLRMSQQATKMQHIGALMS
ncbi:Uncharacterized protein FKW44_023420 [Caligus rogercresseyi]|uniref:Uncharacterized protein n=1 Tax=Caligus rogercresseyi TaxID=217165 RepID=A0A7T8GPJ2_CALRO|nr:Uncharacterized protein FKW44_023420 [Caligus rogercresseyi]